MAPFFPVQLHLSGTICVLLHCRVCMFFDVYLYVKCILWSKKAKKVTRKNISTVCLDGEADHISEMMLVARGLISILILLLYQYLCFVNGPFLIASSLNIH
jgi:hypothetical protein